MCILEYLLYIYEKTDQSTVDYTLVIRRWQTTTTDHQMMALTTSDRIR